MLLQATHNYNPKGQFICLLAFVSQRDALPTWARKLSYYSK